MTCNRCGKQCVGRYCKDCGRDQYRTGDVERDAPGFDPATLREDETPDENAHARRTAEQIRLLEAEREDGDSA